MSLRLTRVEKSPLALSMFVVGSLSGALGGLSNPAQAGIDAATITATRREMAATHFKPVLIAESQSRSKCEADPNRTFVTAPIGTECVAFFASHGYEPRRQAVVFFGGDFSPEQDAKPGWARKNLEGNLKFLQFWADKSRVRYVYVSRLGLQGSSGNHADRRFPRETIVMNAVIDALKERLGIDTIAVAGQSGGATIAASMLTLGRKDIVCAAIGSGALELADQQYEAARRFGYKTPKAAIAANIYDPSIRIASIVHRADRRIFVLGDPEDAEVPYKFQKPFVERVKAAGHHALAIEVGGLGADHHDAEPATVPAVGACLNGIDDESIVRAVGKGTTWKDRLILALRPAS
jgi:pimeloyl-ACP methyl ester carboxylesterase